VSCLHLHAQDTIIKYNGERVVARVLEITPTEVRYKRFNFADGPTYIDLKEAIKVIKYPNGLKDEFTSGFPPIVLSDQHDAYYIPEKNYNYSDNNKIYQRGNRFYYRNSVMNENELRRMLLKTKDKKIAMQIGQSKDSQILQFIGFGAIPLGIAAIYLLNDSGYQPFYNQGTYNHGDIALSAVCLIGAIACPIGSGIFKHKRKISNVRAVELYNEKY
jgi:hypothetical protein